MSTKRITEVECTTSPASVSIDKDTRRIFLSFDDDGSPPSRVLGYYSFTNAVTAEQPVYTDTAGAELRSWWDATNEVGGRVSTLYVRVHTGTGICRVTED